MLNRRHFMKTAAATVALYASSTMATSTATKSSQAKTNPKKTPLNIVLFDGFETIDVMGPVEMLAYADAFDIRYYSLEAGIVHSAQGVPVVVQDIQTADKTGLLLVPGAAPQWLKQPKAFFDHIKVLAESAPWVLTVCTGSVLLARTGLLDTRKATTNKNAMAMAMKTLPKVNWQKKARWTVDGKFYTSSGITAGMDMALGFIADQFGDKKAQDIAQYTEYLRNKDPSHDPFTK